MYWSTSQHFDWLEEKLLTIISSQKRKKCLKNVSYLGGFLLEEWKVNIEKNIGTSRSVSCRNMFDQFELLQ